MTDPNDRHLIEIEAEEARKVGIGKKDGDVMDRSDDFLLSKLSMTQKKETNANKGPIMKKIVSISPSIKRERSSQLTRKRKE